MEDKKPLSPHIQIYRWHISSLVSISHRITGIINIIAITFICLWSGWLILGEANYTLIIFFLKGKNIKNKKTRETKLLLKKI